MTGWDRWTTVTVPNETVWGYRNKAYPYPLKNEILEWLTANVGPKAEFFSQGPTGDWHNTIPISDKTTTFYFRDAAKAVMFKLTWV